MLLVVSNYQDIREQEIPWAKYSQVLLVHCVEGGVFELKRKLKTQALIHHIPLHIMFIIPPVEIVPPELLLGCGLTISKEVELYGQQINHTIPSDAKES